MQAILQYFIKYWLWATCRRWLQRHCATRLSGLRLKNICRVSSKQIYISYAKGEVVYVLRHSHDCVSCRCVTQNLCLTTLTACCERHRPERCQLIILSMEEI